VIRDQPTIQGLPEGAGGDPNGIPFQDLTVNNIPNNATTDTTKTPPTTTYTPAVLHMEPGEKQFWRVSNSTSDTILDLQVRFDGMPQTIQVVAVDGVPVNSQDGSQPGGLIAVHHFRLPPASRVEFIVNAPSSSVKLAQLVTLNILSGHCHILGHEDLGMMNIIQVIPPVSAAASAPKKVIASFKTHSSSKATGQAKANDSPASTAAGTQMKMK
jgi:FtsP/CotA-like multicopper oxidase with cupredoxin domain